MLISKQEAFLLQMTNKLMALTHFILTLESMAGDRCQNPRFLNYQQTLLIRFMSVGIVVVLRGPLQLILIVIVAVDAPLHKCVALKMMMIPGVGLK